MNQAEVVIAGAGIAGITTAWHLAERQGIHNIILVDPRPPLSFTSDKTGANYRDWWPARPMVELTQRSIQLAHDQIHSGAQFTMNRRGYLYVSLQPDFSRTIETRLAPYRAAGLEPEAAEVLLDPERIRRTYAHLSTRVSGAIHARNAGTLDTVGLGKHLLGTAQRRGVRLVRGEVTGVEDRGGRVSSVRVGGHKDVTRIECGRFVNATGPFVNRVAGLMGTSLPVINVLQQKIAVPDPTGAVPPQAPFTISLDPLGSLPGGLHIKPDSSAGRAVVKLGCAFNQEPEAPAWDPRGTSEFVDRVLDGAAQLIPALRRDAIEQAGLEHEAGYYTRTPDDLPLIGPSGHDGAFVAGGLAGYGAMVACAVGEIAAAWVSGASPEGLAARFRPDRFENSQYTGMVPAPSGAL